MNRQKSSKTSLLGILLGALRLLPLTDDEHRDIVMSFHISYETHLHAPTRATGEPYFSHIFRQVLRVIKMMFEHEVVSARLICVILLHDTIEDAKKGKTTPFMVTTSIYFLTNNDVVTPVKVLTKNKEVESRGEFLVRIIRSNIWLAVVAKPFDAEDNIKTLAATERAKQAEKVREIFWIYPIMRQKAIDLTNAAEKSGDLRDGYKWIGFINHIHRDLRRHAYRQRRRLENENIKVL